MSQIHEFMADKVIPESVMPQNIPAMLLDDDGVIPELDAFTFLNRVRALGIGSADFLYLLKGCDAPQEAIDKIENNPAMNLQNLVVTLESSGLTSQDYTRMLYTARQIWERTLTMRIEKKTHQPVDEPTDSDDTDDVTDEEISESVNKAVSAVLTARQKPRQAEQPVDADEDVDEADGDPDDDIAQDKEILTARQKSDDDGEEILTARQQSKKEYVGREDYDDFYDEDRPVARYNGKIAVAAVFALLLIALNAAFAFLGIGGADEKLPTAEFASDSAEIFADIHTCYNSGRIGGSEVMHYIRGDREVFGDMLITKPQELGAYTLQGRIFSAENDRITVYEPVDGGIAEMCSILPPEGARFVEMIAGADRLTAVYAGSDSAGIIAYDGNASVLYSSEQSGALTDLYITADSITLGTVYTPPFTQSFRVEQTEFYLPQFTLNGTAECMLPAEVLLGEPQGCSYAVRGCYSIADGTVTGRMAALGDPVFSGAEQFLAVMKSESGYALLGVDDEGAAVVQELTGLVACDIGDTFVCELSESAEPFDSNPEMKRETALVATAEKDENGAVTVYLRGFDYQPVAAIANVQGEITSLKISGGVLYVLGEEGVLMAADVTDPQSPAILALNEVSGIVEGDLALCSSVSGTLVKLTLYSRDESGAVSEAGSASNVANLPQGGTVTMCGGNTYHIGENHCGAAYSYFDGVSKISEYAVFGRTKTTQTLFDKTDFTCAAELDGTLYLIYGDDVVTIN